MIKVKSNEEQAFRIIEELEMRDCGIIAACYSNGFLKLIVRDENKAKILISYLL